MKALTASEYSDQLLKELESKISSLKDEGEISVASTVKGLELATRALHSLRDFVAAYRFKDIEEEVQFFRLKKPLIASKHYYLQSILDYFINEPVGSKKKMKAFIITELERVRSFTKVNIEFYQYWKSSVSYRDEELFSRKTTQYHFQQDSAFFTSGDDLAARFMANDLLCDFLKLRLRELHEKISTDLPKLTWTSAKIDMIELIYSLHTSGAINNGETDIKQIAKAFEGFFNLSLGNYYDSFNKIRLRKNGQTTFLDALKSKLMAKVESMDE